MMNKKQFDELLKQLKKMENKLDTLITVSRLSAPKQITTDEEKKILKFCNKKSTVVDIMRETKKTRNAVDILLSNLRSKGIIKSMTLTEKDPSTGKRKIVYVRA